MKILILYFEPSNRQFLQLCLEGDGYTSIAMQSAAEVVQTIEDSSDYFLLFTDNYHVNPEAHEAFTTLRARPELRQRVWIVGLTALDVLARQLQADGLMDEHLPLPFTLDQVLDTVEARARQTGDPPP